MKGIIKLINPKKGMVAVEIDTEDFTVFEVLGSVNNFDLGDEIIGPLDSLGSTNLRNRTKSENFDVFIQDIHCDRIRAIELLK